MVNDLMVYWIAFLWILAALAAVAMFFIAVMAAFYYAWQFIKWLAGL